VNVLITTTLNPEDLDCLLESFPEVDFRVVHGSDVGEVDPSDVDVLFCDNVGLDLLSRAASLRWIHGRSTGVDHLPLDEIARRGITLTNGRGAHGIPVAETALAMMLAFATGLPAYTAAQRERQWVRPVVAPKRFELEGQTLLVIGLGSLGSALARKARGIGMTVIGCDLTPGADSACVHRYVDVSGLDTALPQADHVALCLPLTTQTRGFMDRGRLSRLKPGAYLYNVGRGAVADQDAIVEALRRGSLAGAGLDVTAREPIPEDDPIWTAPNVILTQHSGGASPMNSRRAADLFSQNLHRFVYGYPLLNVVDPLRGY
jgi:phosphoglycerate dehydrogenase-like enzyme